MKYERTMSLLGRCRSILGREGISFSKILHFYRGMASIWQKGGTESVIHLMPLQSSSSVWFSVAKRLYYKRTVNCKNVFRHRMCSSTFDKRYMTPNLGVCHRSIHFTCSNSCKGNEMGVPDYLKGNVSLVPELEDGLYEEDDIEETDGIEDDIIEFLNSRSIGYEEMETNYIVQCPACAKDNPSKIQEIFIDKTSGYFVCPGCCKDGNWEDFLRVIDSFEDTLTPESLGIALNAAVPLSHQHQDILETSCLQNVDIGTLLKFDARISRDNSRILLPVYDETGELCGYESISLLHKVPQVIRRFLVGRNQPFNMKSAASSPCIVLVTNACDVLCLAQHNITAIAIPNSSEKELSAIVNISPRQIIMWIPAGVLSHSFLSSIYTMQQNSAVVMEKYLKMPICSMSGENIKEAVRTSAPIMSQAFTSFKDLQEQIYHRITHKDEVCGVQWKRYTGLNDLLLGHRKGELTILTGPTGSGKTTLMAEYSLDLCMQGVRTLWGSFEISVVRLCEVMLQQFSGAPLSNNYFSFSVLASSFSSLPMHFLTYHGQQTTKDVLKAMERAVDVWGVEHVIIDNLQFMLGTSNNASDRWWEQDRAIAAFRRFATLKNCHLTLIAHPKKIQDGQLLSMNSIFGGVKVTQEADNVLLLQVKEGSSLTQSKKILQIAKNRYGGQLGVMPLKFHKESLTFSSCFRAKEKERKVESSQKPKQNGFSVKGLEALGISGT
ncbi:mitochondrial DNA helicase isoform X2 [Oratosquilla oratoria]|uniref:mitochondrial DNA helicase isoform X2 n=1 Tax=Oratosquilla oratoria TaxID=337810 RepID=UPI003F75D46D